MSEREHPQSIQAAPPRPRSLFTDAPTVGTPEGEAPYAGLTAYPGGPGPELPPPKSAVAEVVAGALLGLAFGSLGLLLEDWGSLAGCLAAGLLVGMGLGRLTASLTGPTGHLRGLSLPVAMLRVLLVMTLCLTLKGVILWAMHSREEETR